jgi:hypothetical protein
VRREGGPNGTEYSNQTVMSQLILKYLTGRLEGFDKVKEEEKESKKVLLSALWTHILRI